MPSRLGDCPRRGRHRRRALADLRLVAHAERAARHLHAGARLAEDAVIAFLVQDASASILVGGAIHSRVGMSGPAVQHLGGGAEVADVGHARTDEHFIDRVAGDFRQQLDIVQIVGQATIGSLMSARSISMTVAYSASASGSQKLRVGDPGFHRLDAPLQRAAVGIAAGDNSSISVMLERMYSMIGASLSRTVQAAAERSADASDNSKSTVPPSGRAAPRSPGCGRRRCSSFPSSRPSAVLDGWHGHGKLHSRPNRLWVWPRSPTHSILCAVNSSRF